MLVEYIAEKTNSVMKTRLLVVVGLIVSSAVMAQKPSHQMRKTDNGGVERMKSTLALTDEQYASIKNIDSKYAKKRDGERKKYELRRLEERKSMQSMRIEREREIRKVLSPEQSKKFEAQTREQHDKRKHHRIGKRKQDDREKKHGRKHDRGRHGK